MIYNELTLRHFEQAARAGVLAGSGVRRGAAGNRAHGTWVQFDVRVTLSNGVTRVQDARFLAYGCPHVIAVADWVAANGPGGAGGMPESVSALQHRFGVPVEKLGRLFIVEDAWRAALSSPYPTVTA